VDSLIHLPHTPPLREVAAGSDIMPRTISTIVEEDLGNGLRFRRSDGPPISLTTWDLYDHKQIKYPDHEYFTRHLLVSLDKNGLLKIEFPDKNYIGLTSKNLGFRDTKRGTKEWKTFVSALDGHPFKKSTEKEQKVWERINEKLRKAFNIYFRPWAIFPSKFEFYEKSKERQSYVFKFKIDLPHRKMSPSEKRMAGWSEEKLERKIKEYLDIRKKNHEDEYANSNLKTAFTVCDSKGYFELVGLIEKEFVLGIGEEILDEKALDIHVTKSLA
jgi:hypothetical protein